MATNTIKVGVNVTDNGSTSKVIKDVDQLNAKLKDAKASASELGGSVSSRKLAAKATSVPLKDRDYGVERSVGAGTGAAGRDFAKQAQGLGGIVRLYAAVAANVFAVTAAYNALSDAASKSRMIQASELMSKRVGSSMMSLAKNIQTATGYAVSLEEALQFGNLGTSVGLATSQIENLVKIAKGAANALGRDATDSIRRIIQGTAKQEQEILDELGIFVKAKDAYDEYAKKIGRIGGGDALSAAEKVVAFSMAVEKAGAKWKEFSDVEDPFSEFAAKGKEAIFGILEAVNKVFVPILKFITDSSGAITALSLLIATQLTQRTLPQLGQAFKEALTFKSLETEAKAARGFKALTDAFEASNKELAVLAKKRDDLLKDSSDPKSRSIIETAPLLGGSLTRAATGVFGTAKNPKDLEKYQSELDVQKAIEASLKAQIKGASDKEAMLQKIVGWGVLEKQSTIDNLVLTNQAKDASVIMYNNAQMEVAKKRELTAVTAAHTAELGIQVALEKEIASINAARAGSTMASLAEGSGRFAKAMGSVNATWGAFKTGLSSSAAVSEQFAAKMQGGLINSFKGFFSVIGSTGTVMATAATGLTGFGAAAAKAGALIGVVGATASTALSAALGPIMLLWTAWEIFGDKLLGLIPGYTANKKALAEMTEATKKLTDNTIAHTSALGNVAKAYTDAGTSAAAYNSALERESTLVANRIADLIREQEEIDATITARKLLNKSQGKDENAPAGPDERSKEQQLADFWFDRAKTVENATAREKVLLEGLGGAYTLLHEAMEEGNAANILYWRGRAVAYEKEYQTIRANALAAETALAAPWKATTAAIGEATKALDEQARKDIKFPWMDKIKDQALNNAAGMLAIQLKALGNVDSKVEVVNLADALEKADEAALKAGAKVGSFTEIIKALRAVGTDPNEIKATVESVAQGVESGFQTWIKTVQASTLNQAALKSTAGKVREYSDTAKAALNGMNSEIDAAARAIKVLDTNIANTDAIAARNAAIRGYASDTEIAIKLSNALTKANNEQTLAILRAKEAYKKVDLKNSASKEEKAEAAKTMNRAIADADIQAESTMAAARIANATEKENAALALIRIEYETKARLQEKSLASNNAELQIEIAKLDAIKARGVLDERQSVLQDAYIEKRRAELAFNDEEAKLATERQKALAELAVRAKSPGADPVAVAEAEQRINAAYYDRLALAEANKSVALQTLEISTAQKLEDAGRAEILTSVQSIGTGLSSIFGSLGESMGAALEKFAMFGIQADKNASAIAAYGDAAKEAHERANAAAETGDNDEYSKQIDLRNKALKDQEKLQKKSTKEELGNMATVAGATKKLFKEKTAAHKALAATEKVLHFAKMAMTIQEMVMDTTATGASIANSGARSAASVAEAGVDATKAVIKAISSMPFPLNIAAGAATAAVVFALLASIGGSGGSKPSAPPVLTSEQRQETQGTGQGWEYNSKSKQYEKVDVGGGVFGDNEAKVDSINRALEIISETSVMGLSYDNKMLRAMEKIASSITGAAEAIYAVPGIRTGRNFGTMAEETFKGNWTSKVPVVGKLLGSIFGGGTSAKASIEGAGIQLRGTLEQLANDTSSAVLQYKDVMVQFKEDGGWFSSDKKWTERRRETETLEAGITSAISDVFKQSKEMFTAMAKQAGMSASTVENAFASMSGSIDIDLMGLKGEEVITELNAAIGSRLNLAAESIFSMFEKYRDFGEGMVETVARVTDTNAKVSQVIENVGSIGTASLQKLYDASEAIVGTFGSLESFIDKSNFFAENFLDDAAKLLPYQKAIARTFADIGMAIPKSKKEFATLVQSLNLASESGRETYRVLMDVAPAFNEVANSAEDSLKKLKDEFGDTISSLTDFIKKIAEFKASLVLGNQSTLTPAQKYIEARKQFDETYANLASTDTAVAKAARDKFTTTASTFLDTSRGFFASSAAYTADFDTVMARLTSAEAEAKDALTVAEQQLAALEVSNNYLGSISSGISQIVDSIGLSGALGTILPTQAAANGGYMQGLTLVGEKGPEVVDFKSPGRVYSANQTSELFRNIPQGNNNAALVREVSALRQEVAGLRSDQHKQTGDIIMSNYDANRQNSAEITTAITDANENVAWSDKNLVAMK